MGNQIHLTNLQNEELEFYLRPVGRRYGEDFPHLLKNEGFESMEEFDYAELCKIATSINNYLVEALSCQLGVFFTLQH